MEVKWVADMMTVAGKREEQKKVDKTEVGSQRGEGMDRVEEMIVVDKYEVDRSREGRAETDKEKSVPLGMQVEAFLDPADHIDRKV